MTNDRNRGQPSLDTLLCDLVMKGGITSGVIYPKLIHELAQRYRFKNIGGTSAGAIAAGACAAAECGRRNGQASSFDRLKSLPEELGEPIRPGNRSRLLSLFQPYPSLRPHFDVLLRALNQGPRPAVVGMLFRMLAQHALLAIAMLIVGAALIAPLLLSVALSAPSAFGAALAAVVLVGMVGRWAAGNAGSAQMTLTALGVYLLLLWGLAALANQPLSWTLAWVAFSLLTGVLLVWAVSFSLTTWRFLATLLRGLHLNGYGLCSGQTVPAPRDDGTASPALTDWLTAYFDELAGVSGRSQPLTFGDLWDGEDRHAPTAVNLEVMTSAVSQQMIYAIPFRDGTPTLYYEPSELKKLFPPRVTDWIERLATEAEKAGDKGLRPDDYAADTTIVGSDGSPLRPFPRGADLPVVVAVRMSLSFPVLLSAIPLYSVDFTRRKNQDEKRRMREAMAKNVAPKATFHATRIWFSDGGIGSNMPLHMFDALLPGHPTFAANLKAEHPDNQVADPGTGDNSDGRIFLPEDNRAGALRYWAPPNDDRPLGGLVGFLGSIVNTMQNWRDEIQFLYPGFKDRIVQISQRPSEGGLNLDMPAPVIEALGHAGGLAAQRLIDRFHPGGAQHGAGWTNHQTVRLRSFLGILQPGSAALCPTLNSGHWSDLAGTVKSYGAAEQRLAQAFLADLGKLGALGQQGGRIVSLEDGALKPLAQLRITPRI